MKYCVRQFNHKEKGTFRAGAELGYFPLSLLREGGRSSHGLTTTQAPRLNFVRCPAPSGIYRSFPNTN